MSIEIPSEYLVLNDLPAGFPRGRRAELASKATRELVRFLGRIGLAFECLSDRAWVVPNAWAWVVLLAVDRQLIGRPYGNLRDALMIDRREAENAPAQRR